ncbi:hypothetical protein AB1Y20_012816 [Prymnesium parvum]
MYAARRLFVELFLDHVSSTTLTSIKRLDLIGQVQTCNPTAKRLLVQYYFENFLELSLGADPKHTVLEQLEKALQLAEDVPIPTLNFDMSDIQSFSRTDTEQYDPSLPYRIRRELRPQASSTNQWCKPMNYDSTDDEGDLNETGHPNNLSEPEFDWIVSASGRCIWRLHEHRQRRTFRTLMVPKQRLPPRLYRLLAHQLRRCLLLEN